MPRVEIIPDVDPTLQHGTPTIDVCRKCLVLFEEGKRIPTELVNLCEGEVGSVDVEHPPFADCDYKCESCGKPLTEKDD